MVKMVNYSLLSVFVIVLISQRYNLVNAQCQPNPCLNGGQCVSIGSVGYGYMCVCPSCCNGANCQTCSSQSNPCATNPCLNGGRCIPYGSGYQCSCPSSCTGFNCQSCSQNACSSSPCKNGGACTAIGSTYQCKCPSNCQGYDCSYCPGTTAASCKDFNSNVCKTYAALGYCNTNSFVNGALFKVSCALSCNACTTTNAPVNANPTCVDTQANCVYWANLCHLIPYPNPCPKTCKLC